MTCVAEKLLAMGVDVLTLEQRIITAAAFALDQMEVFDPYDHHAACDLALKRALQIVELAGLSGVIRLTAKPLPMREMEINFQWCKP